jgi:exosortase/archaeosortase family protein
LGIPVVAYGSLQQADLYILEIGRFVFHVEHQCSGISAFFIYFAALLAYPAVAPHKIRGLLLSIPAFFIYGAIRLVVLGVIAITIPDLLRFFHLYFMVILNIGFVMMLWTDWTRRADAASG